MATSIGIMSSLAHLDGCDRTMLKDSTRELVRRLGEGDRKAREQLFDLYAADVNRVVWRLLGADREHDDLVQQCFVNILKSVRTLREPDSLRAWVTSVAIRTVRHELRKRKVRRIVSLHRDPPERVSRPADHEGRSVLQRAFEVLDGLPSDDRIAFCLRYIDEQPLAEVAKLSECSLATAKRRIARAKAAISAELGEDFRSLAEVRE